jgi:hypothetical protein
MIVVPPGYMHQQQQQEKKKPKVSWQIKAIGILVGLGASLLTFWYLKRTLDPITKAHIVGGIYGFLCAIPTSLVLTAFLRNRSANRAHATMSVQEFQPPSQNGQVAPGVSIFVGKEQAPAQPTRSLNFAHGPIQRSFHVVGDDDDGTSPEEVPLWQ